MTATWATRLAADHGHDLRLYVTVQGIPYVFHEDAAGFPSTLLPSGATAKALVVSIEQSETRLNLATRRVEGASLTVRLQDDDSGTLASLFRPRQYRKAFVTSSVTTTGDITISNVSSAGSSGVAYIGGESVAYSSVVGSTLTGCTRGAFSSVAQAHPGGSDDGEDVYFVPPAWEGRRVFLTGYFLPGSTSSTGAVLVASALSQQLATFRLSAAPKHLGDGVWELSCGDLIEEFADKKIAGGFTDLQVGDVTPTPNGDNYDIDLGDTFNGNQFVLGGFSTHVLVKKQSGAADYHALVATSGATITVSERGIAGHHIHDSDVISEVRHTALLVGSPGIIALYALASRLGDGTNGTYDQLPGYDPTSLGEGANRMGAGILESELDTDGFLGFISGDSWSYPFDDEVTVSDFLFDWCLFTGAAYLTNRSGQLTVIRLSEDGATSVMTVDDDIVADNTALTMTYDESQVYPRLRAEINYDPLSKQYRVIENLFEATIQRRYPGREASLELKSKSLIVDRSAANNADANGFLHRPALTQPSLQGKLERIQLAEGRGRVYVAAVCHLPILKAQLGDVVTLNNLDVPDGESAPNSSGVITLSSQPARIVAMRPRYNDAEVDVTFQLLDKLWRVAPACTIASRSGAVLTLNTSDIGIPNSSPGNMFADTGVVVWDVSAGVSHQANVIAHTTTTITLDAAPAFSNEANVDFVKIDSQPNGSGATSDDGYTDSDWLYMMPADENDGSAVEITRWR